MPENKVAIDLRGWDLHRSSKENRVDILRALIARGDDVDVVSAPTTNMKDENGLTPLLTAAVYNSLETARLLIEKGADVDAQLENPITNMLYHGRYIHAPITMFVWIRDPNGVHGCRHIRSRKSSDARIRDARTPLQAAAGKNSLHVARLLIEHGAKIEARNEDGDTPLHWAARSNFLEMARLLIEHGAEVDAMKKPTNNPYDYMRQLFEHGAEVDATGDRGPTPLHAATSCKSLDVARLLIEHGANTDGIDLNWMDDQQDA